MAGGDGRRPPPASGGRGLAFQLLMALILLAVFGAGFAAAHVVSGGNDGSTNAGKQPGVSDCGFKPPVSRPATITATCADGGQVLHSIRWTTWGSRVATGVATMVANDCQPSCADGSDIRYPVEVILDGVRTTSSGGQFTRMIVVYQSGAHRPRGGSVDVDRLITYSVGR